MANKKRRLPKDILQSKVEQILPKRARRTPRILESDAKKLIHELQIHQIELEIQNEELLSKQEETEEIRKKYVDLYDFAPVGYFTFDQKGKILEVNLTGANLLGRPRSKLIGRPFTLFVEKDFISFFYAHLAKVCSGELDQTTELKIRRSNVKSLTYVLLRSMAVRKDEEIKCRTAMTDITNLKLAEQKQLAAYEELSKTNERLHYLSNRLLAVQEEERKRIALEVHDSFASTLSAIKYKLQDIPLELKKKYNLEEISKQLDVAVAEARRIQAFLRPSSLDDLGIAPALNWYFREFQKNYAHITIEKQLQLEDDKIPDSIKIAIYRITQEALNNTARHSKANLVSLSLIKKDASINLVIQDNGEGFDVDTMLSGGGSNQGLGLSSMRERVILSGGSFYIRSIPGKGTIVRASWPLQGLPIVD